MPMHGKNTTVLVNAQDLSTYFNSVDWARSCDTAETTTFGKNSKTYLPGLHDGTLSTSGLFDGAAGAVDAALAAALGAGGTIVSVFLQGAAAAGGRAKVCKALQTSHDVNNAVGDVVGTAAEFQADGGVWGADVLLGTTAVTATGTGAGVDGGYATTDGWVANLHVVSVTGTSPSLVMKVQDSADNTTFADLAGATFTAATTAGAQQLVGSSTVRRYLRASYTITGTTPSFVAALTVARK